MRKILSVLLSVIMLLPMTNIVFANEFYETLDWSVYIENEEVALRDKGIIEMRETVYLPLNQICTILGYAITEKDNTVSITEGEECKNTKGTVKSVQFEIGTNIITSETKSHTLNIQEEMHADFLTTRMNEEIYMSALHFGRAFDLYLPKLAYGNNNLSILTRNYCEAHGIDMPGIIIVTDKTADGSPHIAVNGKGIDFKTKPFIDENGRTQMPVREFCEFLDKSVMWIEEMQTVSVSSVPASLDNPQGGGAGGASFWFTIGEKRCRMNGTYFEMDTAAQIIDGRTFVPLRYLAEMMNYTVQYNPVTITAGRADYIVKFVDADGNILITEKDIIGCERYAYALSSVQGPAPAVMMQAVKIAITDEARARVKEKTKAIAELPTGENYVSVLIHGEEKHKSNLYAEIDSNYFVISSPAIDTMDSIAIAIYQAIKEEQRNVLIEPYVHSSDSTLEIGFKVTNNNDLPLVLYSNTSNFIDVTLYNASGEKIQFGQGSLQVLSEKTIEAEEIISEIYTGDTFPAGPYKAKIKWDCKGAVGSEEIHLIEQETEFVIA